jgi:hypothetical protein
MQGWFLSNLGFWVFKMYKLFYCFFDAVLLCNCITMLLLFFWSFLWLNIYNREYMIYISGVSFRSIIYHVALTSSSEYLYCLDHPTLATNSLPTFTDVTLFINICLVSWMQSWQGSHDFLCDQFSNLVGQQMIDTHHEGGSYIMYAVYCTLFPCAHCEYGIHIHLAKVMLFFNRTCSL